MPTQSARCNGPLSELSDDYEIIILPDGTEVKRERQTKAQARIQALRIKQRNEQLRRALMSLSSPGNEPLNHKVEPFSQAQNSEGIQQHLKTEKGTQGMTAIEKQIIANAERKTKQFDPSQAAESSQLETADSIFPILKKILRLHP